MADYSDGNRGTLWVIVRTQRLSPADLPNRRHDDATVLRVALIVAGLVDEDSASGCASLFLLARFLFPNCLQRNQDISCLTDHHGRGLDASPKLFTSAQELVRHMFVLLSRC